MSKSFNLITFFTLLFVVQIIKAQNVSSEIDSLLQKYEQPNSPGLGIGVIKDGNLIYSKSIGLASLEYNVKNSDSTIFSLASIAKQFTAACVWTLIKEKKLSLDDDIRKYLPERYRTVKNCKW